MTRAPQFKRTLLASAILMLAAGQGYAQTQQADSESALPHEQTVVVLGSRSVAKTALDTSSPVGLISLKDLQTAGPLTSTDPRARDPLVGYRRRHRDLESARRYARGGHGH